MRALSTTRLELEPVTTANARTLWRVLQEPGLREFQDIPRVSLEEFERQVRARPRELRANAAGRFEWLIRARESGETIGWVSLRVNDRTRTRGELGYTLIQGARGKGYATEALSAIVAEGFTATDLEEVQACIVPENVASRAVLARAGFVETRGIAGGALVRNRRVDINLYVYTRAQELARRRSRMVG